MRSGAVVAFSLISINTWAADLYVATTGNDSSSGAQSAPLKTIAKAAAVAKAGTTIHVAAGTYTGNFVTRASGTSSAHIKYVSEPKWGAKLVGTGTEILWHDYGNYIEVDGFDMRTSGRIGFVSEGSDGSIYNCNIHDIMVSGGISGAGGAGIDVFGRNWKVHHNFVRNVDAALTTDHRVQGIYIAAADAMVYNNVIANVVGQGVNSWHGATRAIVVNNTISNAKIGILMGSGDSGQLPNGSQDNYVANNILVNNRYAGLAEGGLTSRNTYANNLFFNNPTNNYNFGADAVVTGSVTGSPKFVSATDFHLQQGSAAIDKGTSGSSVPLLDFDGKARVGKVDIGAYEYGAAPVPTPAPTPAPTPVPSGPVSLSATSLNFGKVTVGSKSAVQSVVIKNVGQVAMTIPSAFVLSGPFAFGGLGTCSVSKSYAPGESCTASVVFTPKSKGTLSGSLSIKTNTLNAPMTVKLSGTGI